MTFAATIFLTGLSALAVPVAIHLLARQRTRVLSWGAMDFLRQSVSAATSRRNRLRDILLLLLRMLAVALLVLAFAQPLVSYALLGGRQLETVFVWDLSLSTSAIDSAGESMQSEMRAQLIREIERLPDQSQVRVLLAGADTRWLRPEPLVLTPTNREALKRAISEQNVQSGESQIASAIVTALALENDENTPIRDIAVVHDFQKQSFQVDDEEQWRVIRKRIESDPRRSLRTVKMNAGLDSRLPQVGVVELRVQRDCVAPEAPARIQAVIRNHSPTAAAVGSIIWYVDGRQVEQADDIELAPNTERQVEQVLRFESTGSHLVACEFRNQSDQLPDDNRAECVVSVQEALPVLIVDDTRRTQRGQICPSEFIVASLGGSLAKQPKDTGRRKPPRQPGETSLFAPRVIESKQWKTGLLDEQVAVFLVSADELSASAITDLQKFVREGGGVWLILNSERDTLAQWETDFLSELGLEALTDTDQTIAINQDQPFGIKAAKKDSRFASAIVAQNLDLYRAEVGSLHQLNRPVVLGDERLLETNAGLPLLLSLRVGEGRLMLQTTDLQRGNTNLPILQAFVPLVREIARQSASASLPPRNLQPGDPLRVTRAVSERLLGDLKLKLPDATDAELRFDGFVHESVDTLQPGVYTLFSSQLGNEDAPTELFAVQRPGTESDLERISPDDLAALMDPNSNDRAAGSTENGRWPLAFWLAIGAAACFFIEALLARWIAARRLRQTSRLELRPVF